MTEVSFVVEGLPPAKNEATSMLGQGHSHSTRVLSLLTAARAEIGDNFSPLNGPIVLEVELRTRNNVDPWDATNYLGGIADVLEVKDRRGALEHLGQLAR